MSNDLFSQARTHVRRVFPAKVLGYLALCEEVKGRRKRLTEKVRTEINSDYLPFFSSITSKISPQGAACVHWSFLKH